MSLKGTYLSSAINLMGHDPSVAVRRRHLPNFVGEENHSGSMPAIFAMAA
jgi:hypothetical protein